MPGLFGLYQNTANQNDFQYGGSQSASLQRQGDLNSLGQQMYNQNENAQLYTPDMGQTQQDYAGQQGLAGLQSGQASYLQQVMMGKAGPSLAEIQQQQGLGDAMRAQMAMANSAGGGGPAMAAAQTAAAQQGGQLQNQGINQAMAMRAQEQMQARQEYSQMLNAERQQQLQQEGMSAEQAQFTANLESQQALQRQALAQQGMLGAQGLENQVGIAQLGATTSEAQTNAQIAAANAHTNSNLLGGALTAAGAIGGFMVGGPLGAAGGAALGNAAGGAIDSGGGGDDPLAGPGGGSSGAGDNSMAADPNNPATSSDYRNKTAVQPAGLASLSQVRPASTSPAPGVQRPLPMQLGGPSPGGYLAPQVQMQAPQAMQRPAPAPPPMVPQRPMAAPGIAAQMAPRPNPFLTSDAAAKRDAHAAGVAQGHAQALDVVRQAAKAGAAQPPATYAPHFEVDDDGRARAYYPPTHATLAAVGQLPSPAAKAVAAYNANRAAKIAAGFVPVAPTAPQGPVAPMVAPVPSDRNLKYTNQRDSGAIPSDERMKDADTPVSRFLSALQPSTFQYKDPAQDGYGRHLGIMAQDLEKTPEGQTMVTNGPRGKMVDSRKAAMSGLAAAADHEARIKRLELASSQKGAIRGR